MYKKIELNMKIKEFRDTEKFIELQKELNILINRKGLRDKETIRVSQMVDKEINKFYTNNT